jgi:hypothetical protein
MNAGFIGNAVLYNNKWVPVGFQPARASNITVSIKK